MPADLTDASGYPGGADEVHTPTSENQVTDVLRHASAVSMPITIIGALTGVTGGAVPAGGWAISLARLRRLEIHPGRAIVGAGVLLRDVQQAAAASGQFYAPDPTENTTSIGGNIANHASGP